MNSNEEYLDNLLKSIEQKEAALGEKTLEGMPLEGMPIEEMPIKEMPIEDIPVEEMPIEEIPIEEMPVKERSIDEPDNDNIEELLPEEPQTEEPQTEDSLKEEPLPEKLLREEPLTNELQPEAHLSEEIPSEALSDMDLDALLESMNDNEDLAEIRDLFAKAENNEPVSDEAGELFTPEMGADAVAAEEKTPKDKNKFFSKNKLKQFFSRKKKERKADPEADTETELKTGPETELKRQQETDAQIVEEQYIEPQMPDESDIADISELLSSLENVGQESEFNGAGTDLFASADSEDELRQVADLLGDVASEIPNAKETDWGEKLQDTWEDALSDTLEETFQDTKEEPMEVIADENEANSSLKKKDRKQSVFSRILQFLTEEDEEDKTEENTLSELSGGVETLGVTSDENQEVLAQLDKEDKNGKKKKKGKKGSKEKNAADENHQSEDEDEEPQGDKKKKKKTAKEKKPKEPKIIEDISAPRLSKKKVGATFLFAFTVMAAILVCCLFVPELFELKEARTAYYEGNYEACYRALYGKTLSESDAIMYERSEFMMSLQRRMEAYESYMAVDDELRALDALLQAVANQKELLKTAEAQGLTAAAESSYQEVLNMLAERYQLSEEEALKICAYKQDALYTLHLKAIVAGEEFVCPDFLKEDGAGTEEIQAEEEHSAAALEDMLPAEEELTETEFEEGITEP